MSVKLELDKDSAVPLVEQIAAQVRLLIQSGALPRNARLPKVKDLAAEVGVNYNTVAAAYRALAVEGFLVQRTRAGTRVAPEPPVSPEGALALHISSDLAERLIALGLDPEAFFRIAQAQVHVRVNAAPLPVAVLARTPLQAAALAERCRALFGARVRCVPQTLADYTSSTYHLTVTDPDLLLELRDAARPPALYTPAWSFDHDVPAGAD